MKNSRKKNISIADTNQSVRDLATMIANNFKGVDKERVRVNKKFDILVKEMDIKINTPKK